MAKRLHSEFVNHKKFLFDSFGLAHQAVKLDVADAAPDVTRFLYREVGQRFSSLSPFLPDEHARVLNKYGKVYNDRARNIPHDTFLLPAGKFEPLNFQTLQCAVEIDRSKVKRTFTIMMALKRTIMMEHGSFLLPDFFVPRGIWQQKNIRLQYLAEKEVFVKKITEQIRVLSTATNPARRADALTQFKTKFDRENAAFTKATAALRERQRRGRRAPRRRGRPDDQVNYNENYVTLLCKLFDNAMFLGKWFDECQRGHGWERTIRALEEVSHDLYFQLIVKVVIKDLFSLVEHYFRQSRERFSTLVVGE